MHYHEQRNSLDNHLTQVDMGRLPGGSAFFLHGARDAHIERAVEVPSLQGGKSCPLAALNQAGASALTQLVLAREDAHQEDGVSALPTSLADDLGDWSLEILTCAQTGQITGWLRKVEQLGDVEVPGEEVVLEESLGSGAASMQVDGAHDSPNKRGAGQLSRDTVASCYLSLGLVAKRIVVDNL